MAIFPGCDSWQLHTWKTPPRGASSAAGLCCFARRLETTGRISFRSAGRVARILSHVRDKLLHRMPRNLHGHGLLSTDATTRGRPKRRPTWPVEPLLVTVRDTKHSRLLITDVASAADNATPIATRFAYLGRPARYSAIAPSPVRARYPSGVSNEAEGVVASGTGGGWSGCPCMRQQRQHN